VDRGLDYRLERSIELTAANRTLAEATLARRHRTERLLRQNEYDDSSSTPTNRKSLQQKPPTSLWLPKPPKPISYLQNEPDPQSPQKDLRKIPQLVRPPEPSLSKATRQQSFIDIDVATDQERQYPFDVNTCKQFIELAQEHIEEALPVLWACREDG
jgi:hypothetical protein